jgi:hypothetical protein
MTLFEQYLRSTPPRMHSTQGWVKYQKANAGAYDSAASLKNARLIERPSSPFRYKSFEETYGVRLGPRGETIIALDQMERRGGNVVVNGREYPECLEDASPLPQPEVATTDNQPDHGQKGQAPPWGEHDEPRYGREEPMEPHGDQIEAELPSERMREPESVARGQQGEDQEEHEDREQDQKLIDEHITKLVKALARDRARRRAAKDQGPPSFPGRPSAFEGSPNAKLAGDSASFLRMYPDAARLTSYGSGAMVITAKTHIHRSRG